MIKPGKREADLMLTLPRNEAGFGAFVTALKQHRDKCVQEFNVAASRTVFDESVRPAALAASGQVKALNDVIELLDRLTVGGTDGR
jgi:hypothetical protein